MADSTSRATVLEPAPTSASADVSPRRRSHRFRPRVLLVESDKDVRASLALGLVGAGFEVIAAPAIEDILGELGEGRPLPHLVLAPVEATGDGMDGFTFCERLRADARTEHLPVYLLSHHEAPHHRERADAVRADDYLLQPVPPQVVVSLARLKAGRSAFAPAYEAHTARMPLAQVLHALLCGSRAGRIELRDNTGWLSFRQGHVVDASFEGERGLTAIRRLLLFGSGAYAVSFAEALAEGKLFLNLKIYASLLLPAAERFAALCTLGIPLSARLVVDFKRLADMLKSLPDDVGQVIRLFDGQRTVHVVLLECGLPEVTTLEVVTYLYAQGVLVPANLIAEHEPVPQSIPPFFEPVLDSGDEEEPFSEAFESAGPSRAA
ncbi:response regulator [Vitiosangium sp. GDMCC 1.1324]|uniref:response regulator n=1 Tax=Vitiosangium sp. (strain GDMCC 1.1324) TaxID=2138576 RepID=UPI000D37E6EF|nr:response regulator [Vitiosangium sp. GDMCC 1.1324]PTL82632.1 response regulator [Vitiosangium sp. GDMCC 1.1324]